MRALFVGIHMAHLGSTSLFGLYLAMGGVLAVSQGQCMLGWGVVTDTPPPLLPSLIGSIVQLLAGNFRWRKSDRAAHNWKLIFFFFFFHSGKQNRKLPVVFLCAMTISESELNHHLCVMRFKISSVNQ